MRKIFNLAKSQTAKDSLVVLIGLGVMAVVGFVFTVVLARILGPNNFGIYSAITALATIVYSLGDLGISPALINFIPKHHSEKAKYLTTGFWLQFAVAVIVFLFFLVISFFHELVIPGSFKVDLLLAGGLSVNYLFIGFAQGIFTAEKRFWSYTLSQAIDPLIKIAIVFALLRSSNLNISTALIANFISTLLALLITFWRELYGTEFEIGREIASKIIHYAKWIAFSRIFSVMISKIDVVLLNIMIGSFQTGVFSAASRVAFFFPLLISGLGSVVNSRYSSFTSNRELLIYSKKLTLLVIGIVSSMVICAVFAEPIVNIVYGNQYTDSVVILRYLIISMIPFVFTLITTPALLYTFNQPAFYAQITAIQVISIVALDILLIPRYGAMAPVIAMGMSNIFLTITSIAKLNNLIHEKVLDRE